MSQSVVSSVISHFFVETLWLNYFFVAFFSWHRYDGRGHLHDLQAIDASRLPDGALVGAELYGDAEFQDLANEEAFRDLGKLQAEEKARERAQHESEMEEDYLAATRPLSPPEELSQNTAPFGAVPFSYADSRVEESCENKPVEPDYQTGKDRIIALLWTINWLIDWMVVLRLFDWLTDWLIDWLPARQNVIFLSRFIFLLVDTEPVYETTVVSPQSEQKVEEIETPFVPREGFEIPSQICLVRLLVVFFSL